MTDLEITKLCAEAMGITICEETRGPLTGKWFRCDDYDFYDEYKPLHDDAQAMALVKKFRLTVATERGSSRWMVGPPPHQYESADNDLNRAICECVAKMQQAKHGR